MKKTTTATFALAAALSLTLAANSTAGAQAPTRSHHQHYKDSSHQDANPLVEEMRKLDGVFRDIVSGVALGDGEKVHRAIETMHGAKEETQKAVHEGEVKPPKNSSDLEKFVMMDNEFHSDLEKLAEAAHKNDGKEMVRLTERLLNGCVRCHKAYRK